MDNASYHNKLNNRAPTSSSMKAELINWQVENNIQHSSTMLKVELYDLVRQHKTSPQHQIDDLIRSAGHEVLRLPPYHPDLNPIENIWGIENRECRAEIPLSKWTTSKNLQKKNLTKLP